MGLLGSGGRGYANNGEELDQNTLYVYEIVQSWILKTRELEHLWLVLFCYMPIILWECERLLHECMQMLFTMVKLVNREF